MGGKYLSFCLPACDGVLIEDCSEREIPPRQIGAVGITMTVERFNQWVADIRTQLEIGGV